VNNDGYHAELSFGYVLYLRALRQLPITKGPLLTLQAWIRAHVRGEVSSKAVDLAALLEGKAAAFVGVHSAGMLHLVASDTTVRADNVPETLLFDVHRLSCLQREFQTLTTASTMLVSVAHSLGATKKPVDAQLVSDIGEEIFVPEEEINLEATLDKVSDVLQGRSTLSEDARKTALRMLAQSASPTDAVHRLM